jgi:hypothetical protein
LNSTNFLSSQEIVKNTNTDDKKLNNQLLDSEVKTMDTNGFSSSTASSLLMKHHQQIINEIFQAKFNKGVIGNTELDVIGQLFLLVNC